MPQVCKVVVVTSHNYFIGITCSETLMIFSGVMLFDVLYSSAVLRSHFANIYVGLNIALKDLF